MLATISGGTAKLNICFKTNELLYVLSCVFICMGREPYGITFLVMAILGTLTRFGIEQHERTIMEDRRRDAFDKLDQVAGVHAMTQRNKEAIH